jgi:ActR/RegA family two-component response regulator
MAKLSHLLLFDTDPSGLETLTYAFEKDGIAVESVRDAGKARARLASTVAPILLVALRDPELVGLDLIRAAGSHPKSRTMACLALGPARMRSAALQAGAFGLVASPLFVRDVLDTCKLIAAAAIPGSRPSSETEVSITLAEMGGVYYLIRALAASARSAVVELQRGTRRGELRFLDGTLSSAQLGGLSGLPALHQLLLWEEADLRLKFRNVVRRGGHLSLKNDEVIEQCDRFLRDFAHEVREMGTARTVYRPRYEAVQPTSALPSEVVPLLRLFDGTRDLARVLDESPFRTFDTLRIARQFMNAGAIVTDPPFVAASSEAAIGGPAALDGWFARRAPGLMRSAASSSVADWPKAPRSGNPGNDEGVPTVMRTSAPFRGVVPQKDATPMGRAAASPVVPFGGPKDRKPRTITQGERSIEQTPVAESQRSPVVSPSIDSSIEATPRPTPVGTASTAVGNAAGAAERPTKPASHVATGEIHITPLRPKKHERTPKPSAPTVLVEIEPPSSPAQVAAVPPSERATPTRLELPGPVTPLPVLRAPSGPDTPPLTSQPTRIASPLRRASPIATAALAETTPVVTAKDAPVHTSSPSPPPDEKTPLPITKVTPRQPVAVAEDALKNTPAPVPPVSAQPSAVAANVAGATAIKKPGVPSSHRTRTPSNGFSAVEADFFNREADLYKGDSPETFDDLDANSGEGGTAPQLASDPLRPVRKKG